MMVERESGFGSHLVDTLLFQVCEDQSVSVSGVSRQKVTGGLFGNLPAIAHHCFEINQQSAMYMLCILKSGLRWTPKTLMPSYQRKQRVFAGMLPTFLKKMYQRLIHR